MNKLISGLAVAVALAGFSFSGATAQLTNPGQVQSRIHVSTITGLLDEIGKPYSIIQGQDFDYIVSETDKGHTMTVMMMAACGRQGGSGCSEFAMLVTSDFVGLPYPTVPENLALMNALNSNIDFGKVLMPPQEGASMFVRYEQLIYGVSRGNLLAALARSAVTGDDVYDIMAQIQSANAMGGLSALPEGTLRDDPLADGSLIDGSLGTGAQSLLGDPVRSPSGLANENLALSAHKGKLDTYLQAPTLGFLLQNGKLSQQHPLQSLNTDGKSAETTFADIVAGTGN